jgi:hypothetical protein
MLNICNTEELNFIQSTHHQTVQKVQKKYKQYKNVGFNVTRTARKRHVFVFLSPFSQMKRNAFGMP